ncbi:MAG TPA: hypothetical protein VHF25_07595, partial [Nitriliruptorales bacterium]|nr:hypothetical protein [Nitriliruptorales bacterium]
MATTAGNLSREEARRRAALVRDPSYEVHLDLRGSSEDTFRSRTIVRFGCEEPGATTFLDLSARAVQRVEINGREHPPDVLFDGWRLTLPSLAARNEVQVDATCDYQRSGSGLHRAVDPVDGAVYLHSQFEPFDAHLVFACFDQPDLKARTTLAVDAPADWQVVSNTPAVGASGEGRWRFGPTPPLPSYLVAVVAGPYRVWRAQ